MKKLITIVSNYTIHYIFVQFFDADGEEKANFTLRPPYQRNVVWSIKQYLKFIESVFCGIVPSPIVISLDTKTNEKTCVDGKQRLTSIKKFFTNKIPYFKVDENKIILYWFNKIQHDESVQKILVDIYKINNFENKLITKEMKSWIENEFQITIIQYSDISYQQQIDIFNRIQYGMTISRGSYLKSFIQDAKLCEYIVEKANGYLKFFGKYIKNENNEDHIKFMIEIFLMLEKNTTTIKTETVDYELKKLTMKIFNKYVETYDTLIKTMFDKELLNAREIKQKKVVIKLLLFAKDKLNSYTFDKQKMKKLIEDINTEIIDNEKKFNVAELDKYFENNWNKKINKIIKISQTKKSSSKKNVSDSDNSDNSYDSDSSCDSDSSIISVDYIDKKSYSKKKSQ